MTFCRLSRLYLATFMSMSGCVAAMGKKKNKSTATYSAFILHI